jgi:hypothetical protein
MSKTSETRLIAHGKQTEFDLWPFAKRYLIHTGHCRHCVWYLHHRTWDFSGNRVPCITSSDTFPEKCTHGIVFASGTVSCWLTCEIRCYRKRLSSSYAHVQVLQTVCDFLCITDVLDYISCAFPMDHRRLRYELPVLSILDRTRLVAWTVCAEIARLL